MSEPFLAEIRIVSFNFAPKGWALCNGQLLPINQNQALFSLLGTTYGGNGQTTFALPDLRGRTPLHMGNGLVLGERSGEEAHTLLLNEMPTHTHMLSASNQPANVGEPNNAYWGTLNAGTIFSNGAPNTTMNSALVTTVGGSQPHTNMQPSLVLNFIIALQGIFPSRN
jgi:microcystin-dependent protein